MCLHLPGGAGRGGGVRVEALSRHGAVREGYLWSQDKGEVVMSVRAPRGTRARELKVSVSGRSVCVSLKVCVACFFYIGPLFGK